MKIYTLIYETDEGRNDILATFSDEIVARNYLIKYVEKEADFYGAMDGASKFVRGDAVAGIMIVVVNIVGGIVIGTIQRGMNVADAAQTFVLLTVGDGLVSQIPALIISTAAGVLVTRAAAKNDLGTELRGQLLSYPRALQILSGMLLVLGLVLGDLIDRPHDDAARVVGPGREGPLLGRMGEVESIRPLPALRFFKIGVDLDMVGGRDPAAMNGAATSCAASKPSDSDKPERAVSATPSNSSCAHAGSSRSAAMRQLVSLHRRCSAERGCW